MVQMKFDKSKFEVLQKDLKSVTQNFGQKLYELVFDSMMDIHATAIKPGYVPVKTGTLKRSITIKVERSGGVVTGKIGSNLPYARIHELGGETGRGHKTKIIGKKYLERGFEENKKKVKERFQKYLAIKKASS